MEMATAYLHAASTGPPCLDAYMSAQLATAFAGSGPSDVLFVIVPVLLIAGGVYGSEVRGRAASRQAHVDVATTGQGPWDAFLPTEDVEAFFPEVKIGRVTLLFLLDQGVPVRLELDSSGLRLTITSRVLQSARGKFWTAPWNEVVTAGSQPAGFKTLDDKLSAVRLTDVSISTVGDSAGPFLDFWDLVDDEDESAPQPSAEERTEDSEWLQNVRETLGPLWHPDSALLRLRMSAPDGVVEAIQRWAHGRLPA
jgi:hypothetical protein